MPRYFQPAQPKPGWQRAYRNGGGGGGGAAVDDGAAAVPSPARTTNASPRKSTIPDATLAHVASPTAVNRGADHGAVTDSLGWLTAEAPPDSAPAGADPIATIVLEGEDENERLRAELQEAKQVLATNSTIISGLEEENKRLRAELQQAKQATATVDKTVEDSRSTIQRLEFRNKELEVQLANAESAKKRGLNDLQGLLKQREAVLADCQIEIRRRKQEALKLDQQMRENTVTVQQLQGRITSLEEENASLRMSTYKLRLEVAEKVIDKQKEAYSVLTADLERQLARERDKNERLLAERSKLIEHSQSTFHRRLSTPAKDRQPGRHWSSSSKSASRSGSSAPEVSPKDYVSPSGAQLSPQTTPFAGRVQYDSLHEQGRDEDLTPRNKISLSGGSSAKKSGGSVLEDVRSPSPIRPPVPYEERRQSKNDSHRKRLRTEDLTPSSTPGRLNKEVESLHVSNAKYLVDTINAASSPPPIRRPASASKRGTVAAPSNETLDSSPPLARRPASASKRGTAAAPSNETLDSLAILDQISSPRPLSVKKIKKGRIKFLSDSSSDESW